MRNTISCLVFFSLVKQWLLLAFTQSLAYSSSLPEGSSSGYFRYPLKALGYQYIAEDALFLNGNESISQVLLDSNSTELLLALSMEAVRGSGNHETLCSQRLVDASYVRFSQHNGSIGLACPSVVFQETSLLGIEADSFNVTMTAYDNAKADNPRLHAYGNGSFSVYFYNESFPTNSSYVSSAIIGIGFGSLLEKLVRQEFGDAGAVVGINLAGGGVNASGGNNSSWIDVGSLAPEFADVLEWGAVQPPLGPGVPSLPLAQLHFCGASLLANWSNYWYADVDTTSTCLTLPRQMYDTFTAYLNSTLDVAQNTSSQWLLEDQAAITFRLYGNRSGQEFRVLLEHLVIDEEDVISEPGMPRIRFASHDNSTLTSTKRLCVVRGPSIVERGRYNDEHIVLGTLALRSLYVAIDYTHNRVGLANKGIDLHDGGSDANSFCLAPVQCIGQQVFLSATNGCGASSCDDYYFVEYDAKTGTCSYDMGAVVVGLVFVCLALLLEIWSYVLVQIAPSVSEAAITEEADAEAVGVCDEGIGGSGGADRSSESRAKHRPSESSSSVPDSGADIPARGSSSGSSIDAHSSSSTMGDGGASSGVSALSRSAAQAPYVRYDTPTSEEERVDDNGVQGGAEHRNSSSTRSSSTSGAKGMLQSIHCASAGLKRLCMSIFRSCVRAVVVVSDRIAMALGYVTVRPSRDANHTST